MGHKLSGPSFSDSFSLCRIPRTTLHVLAHRCRVVVITSIEVAQVREDLSSHVALVLVLGIVLATE